MPRYAAEHKRVDRRDQRNANRVARAVDQPCEHVAPEVIGAEQELIVPGQVFLADDFGFTEGRKPGREQGDKDTYTKMINTPSLALSGAAISSAGIRCARVRFYALRLVIRGSGRLGDGVRHFGCNKRGLVRIDRISAIRFRLT